MMLFEQFVKPPEEIFEDPLYSKGQCFRCGRICKTELHEPIMGKNKRVSMKYKLQVPLCRVCHEYVQTEPSQEYNNYLKKIMQRKFMLYYPELDFLTIFGRNYL